MRCQHSWQRALISGAEGSLAFALPIIFSCLLCGSAVEGAARYPSRKKPLMQKDRVQRNNWPLNLQFEN